MLWQSCGLISHDKTAQVLSIEWGGGLFDNDDEEGIDWWAKSNARREKKEGEKRR